MGRYVTVNGALAVCIVAVLVAWMCVPESAAQTGGGLTPERFFGPWELSQWPAAQSCDPIWPDGPQPPFGRWEVRDGTLAASGSVNRWSTRLLEGAQWGDLDLSLSFRIDKSSKAPLDLGGGCVRWGYHWAENKPGWDASVVFRFVDPLHYYRLVLSAGRGQVGLWDSTGGYLQVIPCELELGKTHLLRLVVRGAHIVAELDARTVMDYWDRTLPHGAGQIGLGVHNADVAFEQLKVVAPPPATERMPAHKPSFRMKDGVLYDGQEPISCWRTDRAGTISQGLIKLRPGWRHQYYTAIGPNIQNVPGIGYKWPLLEGKLPEALKISGQGTDRLTVSFATGFKDKIRAEHICTVSFDSGRQVYVYSYDSKMHFLVDFPQVFDIQFIDPLTQNNRPPGPELKYPWNWSGHRWLVLQGPDGKWQRYPTLDYQGQNNNDLHWGQARTFLYPDPAVCPVFGLKVDWPRPEGRFLAVGQCLWGYDWHHWTRGLADKIAAGTVRTYHVTLTGYPPEEAEKYFAASSLVPALQEERPLQAVFNPAGTDFKQLTSDAQPGHNMVFTGTPDRSVGHGDSCSVRIDGPGSAGVQLYHYMIEAAAKRWWVRGWAKSQGLKGRGLQLRVKYSYQNKPQDVFYIGLLGDRDWTYFSFVTDVLKQRDCTSISFEIDGPGKVWIDDFAIRHLEQGESPQVTQFKMPAGLEPRKDLLVDLRIDEGQGKAAYDYSRNGHSLLLKGATWASEAGHTFIRFDGKDDYAVLPLKPPLHPVDGPPDQYKPVFPLQQFTYEFWVRPRPPTKKGSRMYVFHYRFNPTVCIDQADTKKNDCRLVFQNDHFSGPLKLEARVPLGKWTHLVATFGAGRAVLYRDGKKVAEAAYDEEPYGFKFFAYKWNYNFGAWYYGSHSFLNGDLGPFRLYTRALSAKEVAKAFATGWPAAH